MSPKGLSGGLSSSAPSRPSAADPRPRPLPATPACWGDRGPPPRGRSRGDALRRPEQRREGGRGGRGRPRLRIHDRRAVVSSSAGRGQLCAGMTGGRAYLLDPIGPVRPRPGRGRASPRAASRRSSATARTEPTGRPNSLASSPPTPRPARSSPSGLRSARRAAPGGRLARRADRCARPRRGAARRGRHGRRRATGCSRHLPGGGPPPAPSAPARAGRDGRRSPHFPLRPERPDQLSRRPGQRGATADADPPEPGRARRAARDRDGRSPRSAGPARCACSVRSSGRSSSSRRGLTCSSSSSASGAGRSRFAGPRTPSSVVRACRPSSTRSTSSGPRALIRSFALYFQLVNLAEEHHRVRTLRRRERAARAGILDDSVAAALHRIWGTGRGLDEVVGARRPPGDRPGPDGPPDRGPTSHAPRRPPALRRLLERLDDPRLTRDEDRTSVVGCGGDQPAVANGGAARGHADAPRRGPDRDDRLRRDALQ